MTSPAPHLLVKLTCGEEALERANQALTVAATAVASGAEVSLWLTGEASWLAVPGRAEALTLPHAANPAELLEAVLAAGQVTVCSQCAARRDLTAEALRPGVAIRGAAAFVEEALTEGTQALVY
ncbi:DsrE family protein [Nostocoides australiense]|nr:DsrE family protein [Actinomycetota bacterium]MCB1300169.1 DsrE family protein [Tetrasphaera sp.]HPF81190.1 DsrE family protein [Tetrasphaera australiensis]